MKNEKLFLSFLVLYTIPTTNLPHFASSLCSSFSLELVRFPSILEIIIQLYFLVFTFFSRRSIRLHFSFFQKPQGTFTVPFLQIILKLSSLPINLPEELLLRTPEMNDTLHNLCLFTGRFCHVDHCYQPQRLQIFSLFLIPLQQRIHPTYFIQIKKRESMYFNPQRQCFYLDSSFLETSISQNSFHDTLVIHSRKLFTYNIPQVPM